MFNLYWAFEQALTLEDELDLNVKIVGACRKVEVFSTLTSL